MLNRLKPKSDFSKNVLTLMTGTTIAQAIPIAISPILTRIYTPEDFGVFALYIGIVSFISIIVAGRYELAIVLPKKDEDAINILALSFIIMISMVLLTTVVIGLFKDSILEVLNAKDIGNLLYLVPFSILLSGLYQIFNFWANRTENFKVMSQAQILQSIGIGTTQAPLGYFNIVGGLIIGNILGRVIAVFVLVNNFFKNDKQYLKNINQKEIKNQMIIHKDFPLINSLHAFSDILRTSGSVMLISSFFGSAILGFYSLSLRVLQVPVGIIGSALGQVLYKKFSTIHNNNEPLYPYVKSILIKLILVALPIFGILFIIAPDLFTFVFGEKWRVAGEYSQLLIPYLFINFISSPISQIPIILSKQKLYFYFNLILNIGMPLILLFSYSYDYSFTNTILFVSLFLFVGYLLILSWVLKISKGYSKK